MHPRHTVLHYLYSDKMTVVMVPNNQLLEGSCAEKARPTRRRRFCRRLIDPSQMPTQFSWILPFSKYLRGGNDFSIPVHLEKMAWLSAIALPISSS